MKKTFVYGLSLSAALLLTQAQAQAMGFGEPISSSVLLSKQAAGAQKMEQKATKEIVLMNVKLSRAQKQKILSYKSNKNSFLDHDGSSLPVSFDQGMNGTPVLDQGRHGSCVTFANTAAVDALLGKGDYVSQLCSLELGSYLEKRSYYPSGWDGSYGAYILNQIHQFGIVSKEEQKQKSCAGVYEYPTNKSSKGIAMSLEQFKHLSESMEEKLYWEPLLTFEQRIQWDTKQSDPGEEALHKVKQTLVSKLSDGSSPRITFAVLLPIDYCHAGLCASYHAPEDTWVLTKAMKEDSNPSFGGHELVITGYDDNAVVTDVDGDRHQGLLYIRNSWGDDVGDNGNFYMTYDFFKEYVTELQKIAFQQGHDDN